jgi:general secretion pathway protein E
MVSAAEHILIPDHHLSIGGYLVGQGKLGAAALDRAQRLRDETGEGLDYILTRLGLVSEYDLARGFADYLNIPVLARDEFPDGPPALEALSPRFLRASKIVPIAVTGVGIDLVMANPLDDFAAEAVEFALDLKVRRIAAMISDVEAVLDSYYGLADGVDEGEEKDKSDASADDVERLKELASDAPVIKLVNRLLQTAVQQKASDIHIEPMDGYLRVRFRLDGMLQEVESPSPQLQAAIISRVKIMANLDIAERRLAQDGRLRHAVQGKDIDFRVSTTPTMYGESVVLRILDRNDLELDLGVVGMSAKDMAVYRKALANPHGIVLVTGPTGSGKTTTLYASLSELNRPDRKILTIEDPVEYTLDGINQVQVNPKIGHSFATALRSFLRQDPDIMMVGEIRDRETAQIAVQASLTGHMVLSTLHTNTAATAVTRLIDMGIEGYLLASTVSVLVAQRLVRCLCPACRVEVDPPTALIKGLFGDGFKLGGRKFFGPKGCSACRHTGYKGRTGLFEVLYVSKEVQELIHLGASNLEIETLAVSQGMTTMLRDGLNKALAGETTLEEVIRVTREA